MWSSWTARRARPGGSGDRSRRVTMILWKHGAVPPEGGRRRDGWLVAGRQLCDGADCAVLPPPERPQSLATSHQPPVTHDSTPPVSSRVWEAWRSARAFARRRELNTVSAKDERSARTVFRKLASGGRVRALPQRLRRAGRATSRSLERPGYPPRSSTPAGEPLGGPRSRSGLPVCTARSRSIRSRRRFGSPAKRASLATGQGESRTGPSSGGLVTLNL